MDPVTQGMPPPTGEVQADAAITRKDAPFSNLRTMAMGAGAMPPPAIRQMQWSTYDPIFNPEVVRELTKDLMDPDVKWYKYMAGAMSPTKSGSFGEGVANALTGYADTKIKEAELRAQYMPVIANSLLAAQQARYAQMEKQVDLTRKWNDSITGRLVSLMPSPETDDKGQLIPGQIDPSVARNEILDMITKQQIPPDLGLQYMQNIPEDPAKAWRHIYQLHIGSLDPAKRSEEIFGSMQTVGTGADTRLVRTPPFGAPRVPASLPHSPPPQPNQVSSTDAGLITVNPNTNQHAPVGQPLPPGMGFPQPPIQFPQSRPAMPQQPPQGSPPPGATPPAPLTQGSPVAPQGAPPSLGQTSAPGAFSSPQPAPQGGPPAAPQMPPPQQAAPQGGPPAAPQPPAHKDDAMFPNIPRIDQSAWTGGGPGVGKLNPNFVDAQKQATKDFFEEKKNVENVVRSQRDVLSRAKVIREITDAFRTGKLATMRGQIGGILRDIGVTLGVANERQAAELANRAASGDIAAFEQFSKLAINGAMANLRADIGSAGGQRIAMQEFMQYLNAVSNPNLTPDTLNRLEQDMHRSYARDEFESKARAAFARVPNADYSQFDRYWADVMARNRMVPNTIRVAGGKGSGKPTQELYYARDRSGRVMVTADPPTAEGRKWYYPNASILVR